MTHLLTRPLLLLSLSLLAACGTQPSRFYHLSAVPVAEAPAVPAATANRRVVGLDSVSIPGYLDRPEMVLRATGSRLVVKEFDRWGGPMDEMVTRTLAQDLEGQLPQMEVVELPLSRDFPLDQVVEVALDRFDAAENGPAVLEARWRIFDRGGDHLKRMGRTSAQEPVATPGDLGSVADALSRTLARLAGDLAAVLR
ncbi:PqiC family protein [Azospirillum sp. sgz302134]